MQTNPAEIRMKNIAESGLSQKRLGSLIGLAARQWRRAVDLRLQTYGLTEATWLPLLRLAQASAPMRQKDLAAALSLDSSSVFRILKGLEEAGLIERREDTEDRRAKAIEISRQGYSLVRQVETVSEDVQRDVLAGLAQDDIAVVRQVLEAICDALARLNNGSQTK
jgi:MarR family transcriptional regulator, transcriptional regulator for hemolysin